MVKTRKLNHKKRDNFNPTRLNKVKWEIEINIKQGSRKHANRFTPVFVQGTFQIKFAKHGAGDMGLTPDKL